MQGVTKMKKITAFILIIVILLSSVGCIKNKHNNDTANNSKENNIIDELKNTTANNQLNNNNTTNSNSSNNNVNQNSPTPFCTEHKYVNNVCSVCNCALWSGKVDTSWYSALELEFNISTAEQFAGLVNIVNSGVDFAKSKIYLNNPLDLNNIPITPIGATSKTVFAGTFDGKNNTISNVKITTQSILPELIHTNNNGNWYQVKAGLFGFSKGNISNINLTKVDINLTSTKSSDIDIGCLVGKNYGTISNCYTQGKIEVGENNVFNIGGIIGFSDSGSIEKSNSNITIISSYNNDNNKFKPIGSIEASIGGAIGRTANQFSMSKCSAIGNISFISNDKSHDYILGGLIGRTYGKSYILNSYSTVSMKGSGKSLGFAGGILGRSTPTTVDSCYFNGNIEIKCLYGAAAGLLGQTSDINGLKKSWAAGNITIISENEPKTKLNSLFTIEDEYFFRPENKISTCYYAAEQKLSGTTITKNGTPIPLNDLKAAKFYTNIMMWDQNVWNIVDGQFPTLK